MNSARIVFEPSADATPESESAALGAVYRIILDCRAKKMRRPQAAPTTRKWDPSMTLASQRGVHNDSNVFAAVRELYFCLHEARTLEPYELQGTLWFLHYTNELAPEAEIAAAVEVARGD